MNDTLKQQNARAIATARTYMGHMAWPTVWLTGMVVALYIMNLALFALGILSPVLATVFMAILTYMSYTPLHEAVHGNIHGSHTRCKWLNDLCGYAVAQLIMAPYTSHRYEHLAHHRHTNQPDKDPDYLIRGLGGGVRATVATILKYLWLQNTFFVRTRWAPASTTERFIYSLEVSFSIGWRLLFILLVPQSGTLLVVLVGYLLGGYFTAYWFAYRPHLTDCDTQRYTNTNSLIVPAWMKPLEWFWLGQNMHAVHHLFPRVPFYRYHALHRQIASVLRSHGTPIIGIFNRQSVDG